MPKPSFQAVILAAGRGSRLAELNCPKPLLPLEQLGKPTTSLLQRQIHLLKALGAAICVVVGHRGAELRQALANEPITWIENPAVHNTNSGNVHSLQFAASGVKEVLDAKTPLLVLDADIVYQKSVLVEYAQSFKQQSTLLVVEGEAKDQEQVLVYGQPKSLQWVGKGLNPKLIGNNPCLGEAVGMLYFAPPDHPLITQWMGWLVGDPNAVVASASFKGFGPCTIATQHEELSQTLIHCGVLNAYCLSPNSLFTEIDFAEDYHYVCQTLYPKILLVDDEQ